MNIKDIKFKAKRLDNGKWVEGDLIHKNNGVYVYNPQIVNKRGYSVQSIKVDPSTVCMFAGLKDCYGKEIWEGDIIRNPEFPFEKRTVTWSNNSSCFMPIDEDGCKDRDFSFLVLFKKWTVVGNKFDKEK